MEMLITDFHAALKHGIEELSVKRPKPDGSGVDVPCLPPVLGLAVIYEGCG